VFPIVKHLRLKFTEGTDAEILFTHTRQERQQNSLYVVSVTALFLLVKFHCYGKCEV